MMCALADGAGQAAETADDFFANENGRHFFHICYLVAGVFLTQGFLGLITCVFPVHLR